MAPILRDALLRSAPQDEGGRAPESNRPAHVSPRERPKAAVAILGDLSPARELPRKSTLHREGKISPQEHAAKRQVVLILDEPSLS